MQSSAWSCKQCQSTYSNVVRMPWKLLPLQLTNQNQANTIDHYRSALAMQYWYKTNPFKLCLQPLQSKLPSLLDIGILLQYLVGQWTSNNRRTVKYAKHCSMKSVFQLCFSSAHLEQSVTINLMQRYALFWCTTWLCPCLINISMPSARSAMPIVKECS